MKIVYCNFPTSILQRIVVPSGGFFIFFTTNPEKQALKAIAPIRSDFYRNAFLFADG